MIYRNIYFGYAIKGIENYKKVCEIIKSSFFMGFDRFDSNDSIINELIAERISIISDLYDILFMDEEKLSQFALKRGYRFEIRNDNCYKLRLLNDSGFILPEISIIIKPNDLIESEIGVPDKFYSININIERDEFSIYNGFNSPINRLQLEQIKKEME